MGFSYSRIRSRRVGLTILAAGALACGGATTGPGGTVPIYGECGLEPNYVGQVRLKRWQSFPLTYLFWSPAFPSEFVDDYRASIAAGIRRWDEATSDELGAVVEVDRVEDAQVVITYEDFMSKEAYAHVSYAGPSAYLKHAAISFNRSAMGEIEDLVRSGSLDRANFDAGIAGIAAHEMGHVLGIIDHPTDPNSIMGPQFVFVEYPTVDDINTIMDAYCR